MQQLVRIGCAAGFAGDRADAALPIIGELASHRGPRFLMFETLAERTLALCQLENDAISPAAISALERPCCRGPSAPASKTAFALSEISARQTRVRQASASRPWPARQVSHARASR